MSPALPPVASTLQVRLVGSDAADSKLGTRFYIKYGGAGGSVTEYDTFSTAVATAWNSNLAQYADEGYTLTNVYVADLTSDTSPIGEATVSHAGTNAHTALPLSTCFTLQYLTTLRRRGGHWHGQWRLGTTNELQTPQTWTSAFVGDVEASFLTFMEAVEAAGWSGAGTLSHVGVGYYGPPNRTITGSTGRVRTVSTLLETPDVYPIIGYTAFTRLGSQRKRLGKSGT